MVYKVAVWDFRLSMWGYDCIWGVDMVVLIILVITTSLRYSGAVGEARIVELTQNGASPGQSHRDRIADSWRTV